MVSSSLISSDSAFILVTPLPRAVIQEGLMTKLPNSVHSMLRSIVGHHTADTLLLIFYVHRPKKEALNKQKGPQKLERLCLASNLPQKVGKVSTRRDK